MKFSRLKLLGFKSFPDSTELHLKSGLTGIVGPNGCGKSNLVEALRWVMGENSYKNMRASGMDDVIFAGSSSRPARNTAEVSLVLDNKDRTAPAIFNKDDELEVTRRLEREHGSVYRVNGREVRARDVQLLFADASTGAHSPALVRQGQIGELIAAKPVQRRAILEEAAGISGLHSRRHEAELRLRAAENNLERVDDIIGQVSTQLENLKRQARQATRYRGLSGEIRKAEATLFHLRWVNAKVAEKEAQAEHQRLVNLLADATHVELGARQKLEQSEAELTPLRQAEAEAAAALQRVKMALEQLEADARRAKNRRIELEGRAHQVHADVERDETQVQEAKEFLRGLIDEQKGLLADEEAEAQDMAAAQQEAEHSGQAAEEFEKGLSAERDKLSNLRAHKAQTERSLNDARTRAEKLARQLADVREEARQVVAKLQEDKTIQLRERELEEARAKLVASEHAADAAEAQVEQARQAMDALAEPRSSAKSEVTRLEAEAQAIDKMLNVHDKSLWPAVVDALQVAPGYETALGAALGDDLDASSDAGAPLYWAGAEVGADDPALPEGVTPLSQYVTGSNLVTRRLNQIGLVEFAHGKALHSQLHVGQALVTLAGDLWRWDGFVARADAPSAAAQRLAQRNRLQEIEADLAKAKAAAAELDTQYQTASAKLDAAKQEAQATRQAYREAQRQINVAQGALDAAQKGLVDLTSRRSALEEAEIRLKSSQDEAQAAVTDAEAALAQIEDESALTQQIEAGNQKLAELRRVANDARMRLAGFENAARMRKQRLERIGAEQQKWQNRLNDTQAHLDVLAKRKADIDEQLAQLASAPDQFSDKRAKLEDQIEDAAHAQRRAADKVAVAMERQRNEDKDARDAVAALSKVREEIARIEERLKSLASQRMQIEQMVSETLDIPASRTAEVAGLKPEAPLPEIDKVDAKLDRLKRERERLGGVNLRAEQEATETEEQLDIMVTDREDLIAAIAKLRTGISNLNREGRQRLNEAFEKVNNHFKDLFTQLFGGGTAELTFVESDDPLEAGLEIIARPPGKKPQTMTLLSGGEQALTAMSLIFAVFLTNPAPICVLDEVDAPLDDANVERFCNLLDSMREKTDTRFVTITHNPITMARMDRLFGVTMAEKGISNLVSVDLTTAESFLEDVG
ncbi:chromosome segregation SMC family protein [Maritalea mediterranea]|uniref:Chromosome partition protein Smc n=1 Tax=Maritalea mediterranea TaxID=2909667 RepID=A0ABS9E4M3_9HYPH|nr:AAA family ATPase [Maritalea mediterranea]MCF4097823.1 AAA family ATPase [Maritalea mediterranea]